jgi:hypothetical protein
MSEVNIIRPSREVKDLLEFLYKRQGHEIPLVAGGITKYGALLHFCLFCKKKDLNDEAGKYLSLAAARSKNASRITYQSVGMLQDSIKVNVNLQSQAGAMIPASIEHKSTSEFQGVKGRLPAK